MTPAHYAVQGTVGQVAETASSPRYAVIGGRWHPFYVYSVYLPLVLSSGP